jgi:ABC-type phosphate/phosphonate transport system substrate-binding protein
LKNLITDEFANDALVFREDLPSELKTKDENAIWDWSQTAEGKITLKDLNNGTALKKVTNADYEKDLKMLSEMEEDLKTNMKKQN